jgi:cytochrome c oxidase subunit 2
MSAKSFLLTLMLLAGSIAVAKPVSTPEGFEYCTVCHGSRLMGNVNIGAPRLSGLSAWYIEKQLLDFKYGYRGSIKQSAAAHEMQTMVTELNDEKIKMIAQWASQTHSPPAAPTFEANTAAGEKLFNSCATCHGDSGKGSEIIGAPALIGQYDWYLVNQLLAFGDGSRGSSPKNAGGQQMQAAAALLKDKQDMADVVAYIQQLPQPSTEEQE